MTLAASAAIGFGVAIARAGVERRARRARPKARGLGLRAGEQLGPGLRRQAIEQAGVVLDQLAAADERDARRSVHEARKAIKRLRTIVRLLDHELPSGAGEREQDKLREAAAMLSAARDADVLSETLESLVRHHAKRLGGRAGVMRLRLALARNCEQAERRLLEPANRRQVIEEIELFRLRAESWQLEERKSLRLLEQGLHRLYRQGRRRYRKAAGKRGGRMRTMHQWRKRVKDLRYAIETLQRPSSSGSHIALAGSSKACARARAQAKWLRRLSKRADALGEVLGEEHDLAVLGVWIDGHGAAAGAGARTRRQLLKLIARRRRKLRKQALREGRELYRRKPKRFRARVEKAYRLSSQQLS